MAITNSIILHEQPYRYYRAGSTGPVLLWVHGFPMNHQQWRHQLEYFAESCQVIAPDLRGLGGSSITSQDATVTMEEHANDLVALLDALHVSAPVILVGLSMGGYIAWQMARKFPDRIGALVLCHTRVIADTPEQAAGRHELAEQTLQDRNSQKIEKAMLPRLLAPQASAQLVEEVRQFIQSSSPEGLASNLRGLAVRPDVTSLLPDIPHRSLVISGELDAISPPHEMEEWAKLMPNARFISIPKVGHLSPLESPSAFNVLLKESLPWLTGTMSH